MARKTDFKASSPLEQMKGSTQKQSTNSSETSVQSEVPKAAEPETEEPKETKVGRPKVKTEECKTINIAVPISTLEKMKVAKLKYSNNLTAYVNAVIEADLEANYEKYCQIKEYLNS